MCIQPCERIRRIEWGEFAPLFLILVTLAAYANSFAGAFLFDDFPHILANARLSHPLEAVLFSTRPLVGLTLSANYLVGRHNPADYHLVNLAIHVGAVLVLYGLVRRTLALPGFKGDSSAGARGAAAAVAALWAVHPLQTESVTYIIQRAESMMGFFYLATLYLFVRSADAGAKAHRWQTAAVAVCAAGMATKPVMVTAPLMVLLFDRSFVAGSLACAWRARKRFYGLLACTWIVLAAVLAAPNESAATAGFKADMEVTAWRYLLTQPSVILRYLRLSFWPSGLCLDYEWPAAGGWLQVWPSWLAIGALLAASVFLSVRRHWLGFLGVVFFATLAPTSSFIPIADLAVEHRMYLPLAAVVIAAVASGRVLLRQLARRGVVGTSAAGALAAAAVAALVAALAVVTRSRNLDYRSELGMWQDVAGKRPGNFRARNSLISALLADGRFVEAQAGAEALIRDIYQVVHGQSQFETTAGSAAYHFTGALNHLGRALMGQGRTKESLAQFSEAIKANPADEVGYHNLAVAFVVLGEFEEAARVLDKVLAVNPSFARGLALKGTVLEQQGRYARAATHYRDAVRAEPGFLTAKRRLAWLLSTCPDDQVRDGATAVRLASELCEASGWQSYRALETLAAACAETGQFEKAAAAQQEAISLFEKQARGDTGSGRSATDAAGFADIDSDSGLAEMRRRLSEYAAHRPLRIGDRKTGQEL